MSSLLFAGWAIGAPIFGYLVAKGFRIIQLLRHGSLLSSVLLSLIIFHET